MVRALPQEMRRYKVSVPGNKYGRPLEINGPMQMLHRPGTKRITNPSGGILMLDKYKLHELACSVKNECDFLYEHSIIMDDAAIRLEKDHWEFDTI